VLRAKNEPILVKKRPQKRGVEDLGTNKSWGAESRRKRTSQGCKVGREAGKGGKVGPPEQVNGGSVGVTRKNTGEGGAKKKGKRKYMR